MTPTITAYRDGRFTTEPEPEWWKKKVDRAFDDVGREQGRYGQDEGGNGIGITGLEPDCGRVVTFTTAYQQATVDVWTATDADFLDLLTTRVPAFIGLAPARPIAASLDTLCNAVIAYARHGQGDHVDRGDGCSEIDARRDVADERRLMAAQEAGSRLAQSKRSSAA